MSKTPEEIAQYIEEMTKEYEKYIKPKKKFPPQELIEDYIQKADRDPKTINEIIDAKRAATKEVISQARDFYADRSIELQRYNNLYDRVNTEKNIEKQKLITQISANITQIQACIYTTEQNVSNNISQSFDKQFEKAKQRSVLGKDIHNEGDKASNNLDKKPRTDLTDLSVKQLQDELKNTNQELKTWQALAKSRDDKDRSKGIAKLSDNLASMATTSVNAPRKALALGQALLTYAVVDVLYEGLVKGSAKGLVKGADTGYTAANDRVKSVANNIHKMIVNPQKKLEKEVEKLMEKYAEEISGANIQKQKFGNKDKIEELHKTLVENLKVFPKQEYVSVKDYLDTLEPKAKATMFMSFLRENINAAQLSEQKDANSQTVISQQQKDLNALDKSFESAYYPQTSLPTRVVAGAAGVVPAIVTGIVNAAWEGIKKPTLAATVEMPEGVGDRVKNLKEGKEWARTHSEVKSHREAKKIAEAIGAYAKKAKPEEFNEMVNGEKEKKQKQNKRFKKLKGMFRT